MNENTYIQESEFITLSGSHLYGYSTDKSDYDIRGMFLEPENCIFGLNENNQWQINKPETKTDIVLWGLKHFTKSLCSGNLQSIELLFSNNFTHKTQIGEKFLSNRDLFITKKSFRHTIGFAMAEFRKAGAVELVTEIKSVSEEEIIQKLIGKFQLQRTEINDLLDILYKNKENPRKEVSSVSKIKGNRLEDYNKFGFCPKSAAHSIRLLSQAKELLEFGKITFPRPDCKKLLSIRMGEIKFEEIKKEYEELQKECEVKYNESKIKNEVDKTDINTLLINLYKEKYK